MLHCLKEGYLNQQLFLFHSLGGHANLYLQLSRALRDDINAWGLTLPGHGSIQQSPATSIREVIDSCLPSFEKCLQPNFVFFGHSMGGIVAYFLMQRILGKLDSLPKPRALILSACSPPSDFALKSYSSLSDEKLLDLMIAYDGIPPELMHEKNFLEYLIPIFRADFKVLESSANHDIEPLDIPVYFFWGEADRIAPLEAVTGWSKYFTQEINLIPIPNGSHFFIHDQVDYTAKLINDIMT